MRVHSWTSVFDLVIGVLKESREFVSGLVLNFALILGVIRFEWDLVEIAVLYVTEISIIYVFFVTVALFTPQPIDDRDGGPWDTEPTPLQPISLLPPIYWRNLKFVGYKIIFIGVFIGAVMRAVIPSYYLSSGLPTSIGIAITGIVLFQLWRVWRYFIADRTYRHKSPTDAMEFAFAPVVELYLMFMYVMAPITVVLVGISIAMDIEITSRLMLLLYLVPIGVIRAWIGSLDPQTDDFEISIT
jgi:hypothetical protein